jgi:hypothetical protein
LEDGFQILEDRYRKHSNSTCLTESFTR